MLGLRYVALTAREPTIHTLNHNRDARNCAPIMDLCQAKCAVRSV